MAHDCESYVGRIDHAFDAESWTCALVKAGEQTPLHVDLAELLCEAAAIERRPLESAFSVVDRLDVFMKRPCLQIVKCDNN